VPPAPPLEIDDFEGFWPFYVGQHSRPGTRALHFLGTTLALALLLGAIVFARPYLVAWALVCGYGFAWVGHYFIEKNRPATFQYPLWSLRGDFRMYALMWRGRMGAEVELCRRSGAAVSCYSDGSSK
jgi:hypothetical protein